MDKESIRLQVKARKSLLSDAERTTAALDVFDRLEKTAAFMMASHILMYNSLPDELPTREFIGRGHSGKRFYLPRVNGVNLEILPYDRSRLHLGAFNIEEPDGEDTVPVSDIDLIVVPAVAYDRRGNRVGRGRAFYDRLLREARAVKVGVAFDCQMVDDFEPDPHDVPVDYVITERTFIKVKR